MGRGILSGAVWGTVIALTLLWVTSQLSGMIFLLTQPADITSEAPEAAQSEAALSQAEPAPPSASGAPATDPSRSGGVLSATTPETVPTADTLPADVPQTAANTTAPAQPSQGQAPSVDIATQPPVQPAQGAQPPASPTVEQAPQIAQAPPPPEAAAPTVVMPVAPEMPGVDTQGRPQTEGDPVVVAETAPPASPAPVQAPDAAPDNAVTSEGQPPIVGDSGQGSGAFVPFVVDEPMPETTPVVTPTPDTGPEPGQSDPIQVAPDTPDVAVVTPDAQSPVEPTNRIANGSKTVRVKRLPTIGAPDDDPAEDEPETEAGAAPDDPAPDDGADGLPAIQRYAAEFDAAPGLPVMAIVLIDEGGPRPSRADLQSFPFPVSYAVDANRADAAQALADYRAVGREVIALTPLPGGATPADVEVAFATYLSAMPEIVAVMDTRDAVFQSSRDVSAQVAEILAAGGQGMITYSRGFNAAPQIAERAGVPAKLVFREFDNDGQDKAAIKRFLDQAAFRAGQQSGVILVGHNRPETVQALLEWGLGNRAATVTLAPVSAALLAQ